MSESRAPAAEKTKPYKGPESYQIEDGDVFYGRDHDSEQLIAKILSSRFTLLHAQSGAGKTSLLNARIIPGLETRGWGAFRILPQNDPVASVRAGTLRYVLPHPRAEELAIKQAVKALSGENENVTLNELLSLYDRLEVRDPRRRSLISPIELPADETTAPETDLEAINPYFCRLLRSSIEMDVFEEHVVAILQQCSSGGPMPKIHGGMRSTELLEILSEESFVSSYNKLHNELNVPGRDLLVFFEHLINTYGRLRSHFALVLILDQFEELFTRFIDPGVVAQKFVGDSPDWRLRWEFFDQMERLYGTPASRGDLQSERTTNVKPPLPICYVISMRDEYIAQMAPIRRIVWSLEDRSYHLSLLEKEQATAAIQDPAALFGYTYSSKCFELIIKQLTKEDRYVEPAHLQLVCEKLWTEQGQELAGQGAGEGKTAEIPLETFVELGETKGILRSFFQDFLNELSAPDRLESLELLEPLVTSSGTRNIIEKDQLVYAPFRDGIRRQKLLNNLVNRTIVRTERRLGGYFVEITHEFLIGPILEAIREAWNSDPEYNRYRLALRTLERLHGSNLVGTDRWLSSQEFLTLHEHSDALRWNDWSVEFMLRNAIALNQSREILALWLGRFREREHEPKLSEIFMVEQPFQGDEKTQLTLAELREVNRSDRAKLALTPQQIRLVVQSELRWAIDAERRDIEFWMERMKKDG